MQFSGKQDDQDDLDIPNGYECPILQELMEDPVMAADGHSYERKAIEEWIKRGKKTSPMTGAKLPHTLLTPNHNLRKAITDFREKRPNLDAIKKLGVCRNDGTGNKIISKNQYAQIIYG